MLPVVEWLTGLWGRRADAVRLAYRRAFTGDAGRLVLADLGACCGEDVTSFVPGDPHQTAFREGKRAALLHIRSMLDLKAGELLPFVPGNQETQDHDG